MTAEEARQPLLGRTRDDAFDQSEKLDDESDELARGLEWG